MKRNYKILLITLLLPVSALAQSRNDAGLQGDAGATSGFFDANVPVNFPTGADSWWHLLDVRHSNLSNNYAMQFSGSFFNQQLFFRKTNGSPSTPWSKVLLETDGKVGVGTTEPENIEGWAKVFEIKGSTDSKMLVSSDQINTGVWSHNFGFYGAPAGGITGTATNHPFSIMTNKTAKMVVLPDGNVGIGTTTPNSKLAVNGNIRAHEIKVETANWPDYVFAKDYQLPTLQETEKHIKDKGHLPGIPSAAEVEANGVDLGKMNAKLLQKIEELTLHLIRLEKENQEVKNQVKRLLEK